MVRLHPSLRRMTVCRSPCRCLSRQRRRGSPRRGEEVIAYDDLGAGPGALIGLSEGREAANPFGKTKTPIDAYCACLLDRVEVGSRQ